MLKRVWLMLCLMMVVASAQAAGWTLQDTQGRTIHLSDYKGKWVLVNFWATWCPPCREEIPDLEALYQAHARKDLVVVGVAMAYNHDPASVTQFVRSMHMTYPIVLGDDGIAAQFGGADELPTSYLFNPQGKEVGFHIGPLTRQDIEGFIAAKGH
ncbi:MAG: TlpA disulfide reductase family protein [Betaproteobacteria bacterium]|nr:TlpA disulfide reductase family protein [Betaproteobacteria bacterium]